jgi:hemolysin activation/secretion protein
MSRRKRVCLIALSIASIGSPALCGAAGSPAGQPSTAVAAAEAGVLLVVSRFEVGGTNPLDADETGTILKPYLGEHRSLATLEAAAVALENTMRERGFAFHRVIVPAQRPEGGVVRLEVLHFSLGAVNVSGNQGAGRSKVKAGEREKEKGKSGDRKRLERKREK